MHLYLKTDRFECRYNEDRTDGSLLWENHCHGEFEINYIVEGGIDLVCEGANLRCEKGQLMLLPPLTYHSVTADPNTDYKRVIVTFQSGAFPCVIEEALTKNSNYCPVFTSHALMSAIQSLQKTFTSKNLNDYVPLIESIITQTVYQCAELEIGNEDRDSYNRNALLDRAISYIDEHIKEKILLDDIAASLFVSKSTLSHVFTEQMQTSPKQYILQKKMAYASMLIAYGIPITEVARTIGYENYSSFYRIYKKLINEKQL